MEGAIGEYADRRVAYQNRDEGLQDSHLDNNNVSDDVEWDMPLMNDGRSDLKWSDMANLSLNTGIRNRLWEEDHMKMPSNGGASTSTSFCNSICRSPSVDDDSSRSMPTASVFSSDGEGQSVCTDSSSPYYHTNSPSTRRYSMDEYANDESTNMSFPMSPLARTSSDQQVFSSPAQQQQQHHRQANGERSFTANDPRDFEESVSAHLLRDKEDLKQEIEELKLVIAQLNTIHSTDGNRADVQASSTVPIQLAFKVLQLQTDLQDVELDSRVQAERIQALQNDAAKSTQIHRQEIERLELETKALRTKLGQPQDEGYRSRGRKPDGEIEDVVKLNEKLEKLEVERQHEVELLKCDIETQQNELKTCRDVLNEMTQKTEKRKKDVENILVLARLAIDKGRQEKYSLLLEQNKLKGKAEKLAEALKSFQMRNDDMSQHQNGLEQEVDRFRRLQKLIQEHGLPNHDQLIILQQQAESFKEDILSERKEKERALAQREKLRRDYDTAQARVSSLQEQVCKYQEHIMKLNLEKQSYQGQLEVITGVKTQDSGIGDVFGDPFLDPNMNCELQAGIIEQREDRNVPSPVRRSGSESRMMQGNINGGMGPKVHAQMHFNPRFDRQPGGVFNANKVAMDRNYFRQPPIQQPAPFGGAPLQLQHPQLRHANSAPSLEIAARGRGFNKNFGGGQVGRGGFGGENRRLSSSGQFDGWRGGGNHVTNQRPNSASFGSSKPLRSPVLSPTADPWRMAPQVGPQSPMAGPLSPQQVNPFPQSLGAAVPSMWQSVAPQTSSYGGAVRPPPGCWPYPTEKNSSNQPPSFMNSLQTPWSLSCARGDMGGLVMSEAGMPMEQRLSPSPSMGSGDSSRASSVEPVFRQEDEFTCQNCDARLSNENAFRSHAEKCFN